MAEFVLRPARPSGNDTYFAGARQSLVPTSSSVRAVTEVGASGSYCRQLNRPVPKDTKAANMSGAAANVNPATA